MHLRLLVLTLCIAAVCAPAASAHVLGSRTIAKGDHGRDVSTLQRLLGWKGYHPGPVDGAFGPRTKHATKAFQRRRRLSVDGRVGPQTISALASNWTMRTASYYGPGLYGNRMACGGVLKKGTHAIAHRTLPCGTRVAVYANGRIGLWRVQDRGPHTAGVSLDLTAASARALGLSTTSQVRASR